MRIDRPLCPTLSVHCHALRICVYASSIRGASAACRHSPNSEYCIDVPGPVSVHRAASVAALWRVLLECPRNALWKVAVVVLINQPGGVGCADEGDYG